MIRTLDELVAFTERLAAEDPELADVLRIERPGCSPEEVEELKSMVPGIPDSYLQVVQAIRVNGASIGYFQLSPSASRTASLAAKVRTYSDPAVSGMARHARRVGAYLVAYWEADPIGVVHSPGTYRPGQVVLFSPGKPPAVIAESFEQFLLIAGNLDESRALIGVHGSGASKDAFLSSLASLVDRQQTELRPMWEKIADVVLG
jgi:hypothetical protein